MMSQPPTRADLRLENALVTWNGSTDPEQLQYGQILSTEGWLLRQLARAVPADRVIVEIGSYTGKSTCCLARGSAEGNRAPVFAVDLWTEGKSRRGRFRARLPDELPGSSKFHRPEVLEIFRRRMDAFGFADLVYPIMGESRAVAADFRHSVGLLFIDAEHTYEACRADFEAWAPRLDGGVVALHDYKGEGLGGIKRYVDELVAAGPWQIRTLVGSLVVLE